MSRARSFESLSGASRVLGEGALLIEESLCINLRGRQELCRECAEVCACDALTVTPDDVTLDEERCTACGACLPVCPVGAMRLTGFVPRRFLDSLEGVESAHLHCSRSQDAGGGVVVPCHQVLDARLLAAAGAGGTREVVLHGLDQCAECERGEALTLTEALGQRLAEWLGEAAPRVRAAQPGETPQGERERQDQVRMSRRNFLRMAGAQSAIQAAQWFAPVAEEEDDEHSLLPFYQGDGELRRPSAYQALLAECATALEWKADSLPWRARTIDANCTGCQTCGRRCPTGALEAVETAERVTISFQPDLCTDCRLCETLCPSHALQSESLIDPDRLRTPRYPLTEHAQRQCPQCGHPFIAGQESGSGLCLTCQNEQDIDDDWMAMLSG
ncbi:MAG: 4Fe-4S binding protein [Gammaproteobacteria bacterium]